MPFLAVPAVAAGVSAVSAAAGVGMAALGAVRSGQQQKIQVDTQETQLEHRNAAEKERLAVQEVERERRLRRILATQRATFGAGGVSSSGGSAGAFRAASVGEAAREQYAEDLGAFREQQSRDAQSQFNTYNRSTINPARNAQIGSAVFGAANRYMQTRR